MALDRIASHQTSFNNSATQKPGNAKKILVCEARQMDSTGYEFAVQPQPKSMTRNTQPDPTRGFKT